MCLLPNISKPRIILHLTSGSYTKFSCTLIGKETVSHLPKVLVNLNDSKPIAQSTVAF